MGVFVKPNNNFMLPTNKIIDFEEGKLDHDEVIELFSELIKTGLVWTLQGTYGRTATTLIQEGYLDQDGNIL